MNKIALILFAGFVLMGAFISRNEVKSGIHGVIDPPDAAKKVWATSGSDTFSTIPVIGNFKLDLRPGYWKLDIEAISPYKNATLENLFVQEGSSTDVGLIVLRKE